MKLYVIRFFYGCGGVDVGIIGFNVCQRYD